MVTFIGPSREASDTRHVLYEVKYREELRRDWAKLRPRFRAAHRFARGHGWKFRLITDYEIRTPLLWNAKFLLPYRGHATVRLVCTCAGPTSEWFEERDVDRSLLAVRRPGFIDAAIRRLDERLVGMQNG